ncbi:hypothetical protein TgHK011_005533 [Trichoderma gracile]|nr:hypothetical protein TgHK011_005533 [Trichoderma gracile]
MGARSLAHLTAADSPVTTTASYYYPQQRAQSGDARPGIWVPLCSSTLPSPETDSNLPLILAAHPTLSHCLS